MSDLLSSIVPGRACEGCTLCCKLLPFSIVATPIPFGVVLTSAVITALNTQLALLQTYMDARPLRCPIE